jgi:DNA invertase Pin-like site-specific DNA recombinase
MCDKGNLIRLIMRHRIAQSMVALNSGMIRQGCTTIRSEKRSGTTTAGREELRTLLDFLREGDVLMVTRIDRLARSIGDLQDIVRAVRAKGASLKATEQPSSRSTLGTAAGKCFLDMLGVFAEFETNRRRERLPGKSLARPETGLPFLETTADSGRQRPRYPASLAKPWKVKGPAARRFGGLPCTGAVGGVNDEQLGTAERAKQEQT